MRGVLMAVGMSLLSAVGVASGADHGAGYACDMRAMTKEQRVEHARLAHELFAAVEEQRELANGYAFRLAADRWLDTARWADLERRCCPFFAFELTAPSDGGALWLRITGKKGVKEFMKTELGL